MMTSPDFSPRAPPSPPGFPPSRNTHQFNAPGLGRDPRFFFLVEVGREKEGGEVLVHSLFTPDAVHSAPSPPEAGRTRPLFPPSRNTHQLV